MSTATVQLFASYAEMLGAHQVRVSLVDGSRVRDLVAAIRLLPGADVLPLNPKVAVNHRFASANDPVNVQDEIALIPPVAGG